MFPGTLQTRTSNPWKKGMRSTQKLFNNKKQKEAGMDWITEMFLYKYYCLISWLWTFQINFPLNHISFLRMNITNLFVICFLASSTSSFNFFSKSCEMLLTVYPQRERESVSRDRTEFLVPSCSVTHKMPTGCSLTRMAVSFLTVLSTVKNTCIAKVSWRRFLLMRNITQIPKTYHEIQIVIPGLLRFSHFC